MSPRRIQNFFPVVAILCLFLLPLRGRRPHSNASLLLLRNEVSFPFSRFNEWPLHQDGDSFLGGLERERYFVFFKGGNVPYLFSPCNRYDEQFRLTRAFFKCSSSVTLPAAVITLILQFDLRRSCLSPLCGMRKFLFLLFLPLASSVEAPFLN